MDLSEVLSTTHSPSYSVSRMHVEDESSMLGAMALTANGIELADAIHLNSRPPGAVFLSFDKAFVRRAQRAGASGVSGVPAKGRP